MTDEVPEPSEGAPPKRGKKNGTYRGEGRSADDARDSDWLGENFTRAIDRFAAVLGSEAADRVWERHRSAVSRGDAAAIEVPFALTWGWLLDRPGLSLRERCLAMLAVDVASHAQSGLRHHLKLALHSGLSSDDIRELLVQIGPHCGYPATYDAKVILADLLRELDYESERGSQWGWVGYPASILRLRIVVQDAYAASKDYARLLGLGHWTVSHVSIASGGAIFEGRPVNAEFVTARADSKGLAIELIEPTGGATSEFQHLVTRGPSIHDVCVLSLTESATRDLIDRAGRAGIAMRQSMETDGGSMYWLDTRTELGGYCLSVACPSLTAWETSLGDQSTWDHSGLIEKSTPLTGRRIEHLGIVVGDLTGRTRDYAAAFGRREWPVLRLGTDRGNLERMTYNGQSVDDEFLSTIGALGAVRREEPIGGAKTSSPESGDDADITPSAFRVELIQPIGGPSRYREGFIDRFGDGIQHVFFGALPEEMSIREAKSVFASRGAEMVTSGHAFSNAVEFAYLDTRNRLGLDVELLRRTADLDRKDVLEFTIKFGEPTVQFREV